MGNYENCCQTGKVVHVCNPSVWELEARRSGIQGHRPHREREDSWTAGTLPHNKTTGEQETAVPRTPCLTHCSVVIRQYNEGPEIWITVIC